VSAAVKLPNLLLSLVLIDSVSDGGTESVTVFALAVTLEMSIKIIKVNNSFAVGTFLNDLIVVMFFLLKV
jgi:hypothetical protein